MNKYRIRRLVALVVSHLPTSALRVFLYSMLPGYRFGKGTRVDWQVQISVDSFDCGQGVRIRRGTSFLGPIAVQLADKTFIGKYNKIECGEGAAQDNVKHMGYARRFQTGDNSLINEGHLFDVLGQILIGNRSWVAGFGSQFLTHGAGAMNRDIEIGDDCFLGSAVRFAPGSGLADGVIVGMGAVVTKRIADSNVIIGGVPARIIKARTPADTHAFSKDWL